MSGFVVAELRAIARRLNPEPGAPGQAEEEARVTASDILILADILENEYTPTHNEHVTWLLAERGMSQRNIALALGVSRSTIRSRLENAARKLAQAQKEPAA